MEIEEFRKEVTKLLKFFEKDYDYPASLRISPCMNIVDIRLFVESHVNSIRINSEKRYFQPDITRLNFLKTYVETNKIKAIGERKYEHVKKEIEKKEQRFVASETRKKVNEKNTRNTDSSISSAIRRVKNIEVKENKSGKANRDAMSDAPKLF